MTENQNSSQSDREVKTPDLMNPIQDWAIFLDSVKFYDYAVGHLLCLSSKLNPRISLQRSVTTGTVFVSLESVQ